MTASRLFTGILATALVASGGPARAGDVMVAVASNFGDAARAISSRFEEATGHRVAVSLGSTGMLYAQIRNGAPYDVFLAADAARPAAAEEEGLAVPGTRVTYALGRLVMWTPRPGVFENGESYLRALAFDRLAVASPDIAPYGSAAMQVLEQLGVRDAAGPRLVQGQNIAQAFQFVASGNADAGFVALSQVRSWRGKPGSLWEIPDEYHDPIVQQAVLLRRGRDNAAARAFLDFLRADDARAIIVNLGYGVQ